MIINSSMCPIKLFQTSFQLHCRLFNFNSFCKEEQLKCNRDCVMFLRAQFTMDPDLKYQFDAATLLKINLLRSLKEIVISGDLLCFAPTMVEPRESLNSWNQWINDWPLYQSLFRPMLKDRMWLFHEIKNLKLCLEYCISRSYHFFSGGQL